MTLCILHNDGDTIVYNITELKSEIRACKFFLET